MGAKPRHGHSRRGKRTPTYSTWKRMMARCYNPNTDDYKNYGARGIMVCARWHKFENFLKDMGERPENTTIDRRNPNRNYAPYNCRWATAFEQSVSKRDTKKIKFGSDLIPIRVISLAMNVDHKTILQRLRLGFTPAEAFYLKKGKRRIKVCRDLLK